VYYRQRGENNKSRLKWEYFGRGPSAEAAAIQRNAELGLKRRRPPRAIQGPSVAELAKDYAKNKNFSPNSKKHLHIRLKANLLPHFGKLAAATLTYQDIDDYIQHRRTIIKKNVSSDCFQKKYTIRSKIFAKNCLLMLLFLLLQQQL